MNPIDGFPYFPIEFDKKGKVAKPSQVDELESHLKTAGTTDLIVVSHGWNNDMAEADKLYGDLLKNMQSLISQNKVSGLSARKFAVFGVLWPSKKFADEDLIPSGAAGAINTVELDEVKRRLTDARGTFDAADGDKTLEEMKKLLPKLEDSDAACRKFVELARLLVQAKAKDKEDQSDAFFGTDALDVFKSFAQPASFVVDAAPKEVETGGAEGFNPEEGEALGLGNFFGGVLSGARNVLNFTTYYQMKARAGLVGATGVNPLLRRISAGNSTLRIHLIGHSFGGRLVTAIAAGTGDADILRAHSMSLLQAAFSHNAFSKNWDEKGTPGFFRRVVDKGAISGPIVITFSDKDTAVGMAYPLASLLAGQNAAGLGDKDSPFGGIGRNGAQRTGEADESRMLAVGQPYALKAKRLHNLNSDATISSHGDVANITVAYAVLNAIAAS
jgi:pimeloyl-ACP methyl ester carboxylesterase